MPSMTSGNIIFEKSGQAPSPSKDFHQLIVSDSDVIWRSWRISLRKDQVGVPPSQKKMSHEDFYYDTLVAAEIRRVFGDHVLRYVEGSLFQDWLVRLPDTILVGLLCYLDLVDVAKLSRVCRHLRVICNSDSLWKSLYVKHNGTISADHELLGDESGWKKLFFTDRLQLQKQLSRMRFRENDGPRAIDVSS